MGFGPGISLVLVPGHLVFPTFLEALTPGSLGCCSVMGSSVHMWSDILGDTVVSHPCWHGFPAFLCWSVSGYVRLRTPIWCSMPKFPEEMCSPAQSPILHTDPAAWLWGV